MNRFILFLAVALLAACSQPETQFTNQEDVRQALAQLENARFHAVLSSYTEASDSKNQIEVHLDWVAQHAVGDSVYGNAWTVFALNEDSTAFTDRYHLWASEVTTIGSDSVRSSDAFDPQNANSDNGIPNYYTSMMLPTMLSDTTWWTEQFSDSSVQVVWTHVPPTRNQTEQYTITSTVLQDSLAEDFHPETSRSMQWTFEAPHGTPVRYKESWYRGDMAYGSDLTIDWTWESVNSEATALAVADWTAPDWTREPAPAGPEVAGGGDGDWYEEALEALPAAGSIAPVLEGNTLSGDAIALADYAGQLVYLDFWYIGCGPCMRALPHLDGMQKEFGPEGFTVLGVNPFQDAKTVKRYLDRRELDVPQMILDSLPTEYPIVAYPTWFLIGRDGQIIDRNMGYDEDTGAFLDSLVQVNL
ncbi:MAG: TlpA disulfide reductase family protein [Bacteroidetes bacterium]|jgi:thiol-disulfide isomerase/thioredoxin|nr:TlpA disulfide reductase family protein [Bacteroidota bacterium]